MIRYDIHKGVQKIKTKTFLAISGLGLVLGGGAMSLAIMGSAHAATPWYVNSTGGNDGNTCTTSAAPCLTIQAAINKASSGDVINVATGSYNENVTVPVSLTLNGAQQGVDARTRSGAESVLTGKITVNANNVTVDGFTVNNAVATGAFVMLGGNTGETLKNNIINNSGSAVSFDTSNTTLSQNAVKSNASATEGFQASTAPLSNLTVSNNSFSGANSATYNADVTVIEGNSNVVISGNSSSGDGTLIALFKTNGAQITNNNVVGAANSSAIYIGGANSNVTVSGNQVSSAASAVKVANAFGDGANSNVTITGNTLTNNAYGVNVVASSESGTVVAHNNSITGNTISGISNDPSSGVTTVDGTCNWWGSSTGPGPVGPGSGDKVSTLVNYSPWLNSINGPCHSGKVTIQIFKYVDGVQATAANTNSTTFPMTTTFTSPNLGNANNVPFTLSPTPWGGIGQPYEADFVGSNAGANYTASEVTTGNTVVGTACSSTVHYALSGYTYGDNLTQAQTATKSLTAPQFVNLQTDHTMIVWNTTCTTPMTKADCRNDGWKTFNNPSFKNQGKCIDYVVDHGHKVKGDVHYTANGLKREAEFSMNTYDNNKGSFEYWDNNHGHYKVNVSVIKVNGQDAWFAGVVTKASNPSWVGQWLFAKVHNGSPDQIWGSFTTQTTATAGVNAMTSPADGPFNATKGNLKIN